MTEKTDIMQKISRSVDETIALGRSLGRAAQARDCIALCGDLGAGKTQLTKGIADGLGIEDPITSPTFNIVYEYADGRLPLYHFDLYRLERPEELDDIGYWELVEGDGLSVIEWGERFPEMLPDDHLTIVFELAADGTRTLTFSSGGPSSDALLSAVFREEAC